MLSLSLSLTHTHTHTHTQLIPLLVKSLNYHDVELRISSLESLHLLVEDTPSSISAYVPTLIPILLNLAKSPETMVMWEHTHTHTHVRAHTHTHTQTHRQFGV